MKSLRTFIHPRLRTVYSPKNVPWALVGSLVYDPVITAFAAASGATDLIAQNNLALYLRTEGLLPGWRFYSGKSAQNVGSGSTIYGWGDLSTANLTAVNSPSWGAAGIDLQATHYITGTLPAVGSADEVTVFLTSTADLASVADASNGMVTQIGYYRNTTPTGQGGWLGGGATGATVGEIMANVFTLNADTFDPNRRLGTTQGAWSAAENQTQVYQIGNDFAQWKNLTALTMNTNSAITPTFDCGPTDLGTTNGLLHIGGAIVNGVATASAGRGKFTSYGIYAGPTKLTTTQRETITSLIRLL